MKSYYLDGLELSEGVKAFTTSTEEIRKRWRDKQRKKPKIDKFCLFSSVFVGVCNPVHLFIFSLLPITKKTTKQVLPPNRIND